MLERIAYLCGINKHHTVMTDLTKEDDRVKLFLPDGNDLLKMPIRIENQYQEEGLVVDSVWDTGAQFSVMSASLADKLKINRRPGGLMDGVGQTVVSEVACAIAFPGNMDWYTYVHPRVVPKIAIGVDFIIGLDIITMGDFSLTRTREGLLMEFVFNEDYFIREGDDVNKKWRTYNTIYNLIRKF